MASSRSRPSGGAATADGRRLAHESRDVHPPVRVSSPHASARVKTINHLSGSSIRPKHIRSSAPDLGPHSPRPPGEAGLLRISGCICRDVRSAIGVPRMWTCVSDADLRVAASQQPRGQPVRTVRMKDVPRRALKTVFAAITRKKDCESVPRWGLWPSPVLWPCHNPKSHHICA
jgi:hypothetical protein